MSLPAKLKELGSHFLHGEELEIRYPIFVQDKPEWAVVVPGLKVLGHNHKARKNLTRGVATGKAWYVMDTLEEAVDAALEAMRKAQS